MKIFTEEDINKRKDICKDCEHSKIATLTKINYCEKCKCVISLKVQVPRSKCPAGKW